MPKSLHLAKADVGIKDDIATTENNVSGTSSRCAAP